VWNYWPYTYNYSYFCQKRKKQDWLFVWGGLGLLLYSIALKDSIFIPLQMIFVGASLFEIYTLRKKK